MADEFFGQLVAGAVVGAGNLLHHADGLEIDHVSVHRTLRQRGATVE